MQAMMAGEMLDPTTLVYRADEVDALLKARSSPAAQPVEQSPDRAANLAVAELILRNDRAGAVKWAHGLMLNENIAVVFDPSVEQSDDARDAARWRRLVYASEMPFPIATIIIDPENDADIIYGQKRLEKAIDDLDLPATEERP